MVILVPLLKLRALLPTQIRFVRLTPGERRDLGLGAMVGGLDVSTAAWDAVAASTATCGSARQIQADPQLRKLLDRGMLDPGSGTRRPAAILLLPPRFGRWGEEDGDTSEPCAVEKNPASPRARDPPAYAGNNAPPPFPCQICNLTGHPTARCPQAVCKLYAWFGYTVHTLGGSSTDVPLLTRLFHRDNSELP